MAITGPDKKLFEGTGFRLTSTLVLTARHVVKKLSMIQVLDPSGGKWRDAVAAKVTPLSTELDVCLLQTPPVADVEPWRAIHTEHLDRRRSWSSYAFPYDYCEPDRGLDLKGEVAPSNDAFTYANLTVTQGEPDSLDRFRGISGSPVLLESSAGVVGELFAVVTDGRNGYVGRLDAIPIAKFSEIMDHLGPSAPGYESSLGRLESSVRAALATKISEGGSKTRNLAAVIAPQLPRWQSIWSEDPSAESLAHVLCTETPVADLAIGLASAFIESVDANRNQETALLYDLFFLALPAAFLRPEHVLDHDGGSELRIKAAARIMAEIGSAALDGQRIRVTAADSRSREKLPYGLPYQVALPTETGILPDSEFLENELVEELAEHLAIESSAQGKDYWYLVLCLACHKGNPGALFPMEYFGRLKKTSPKTAEERRQFLLKLVENRLDQRFQRTSPMIRQL